MKIIFESINGGVSTYTLNAELTKNYFFNPKRRSEDLRNEWKGFLEIIFLKYDLLSCGSYCEIIDPNPNIDEIQFNYFRNNDSFQKLQPNCFALEQCDFSTLSCLIDLFFDQGLKILLFSDDIYTFKRFLDYSSDIISLERFLGDYPEVMILEFLFPAGREAIVHRAISKEFSIRDVLNNDDV